jgi:hypothetical protein
LTLYKRAVTRRASTVGFVMLAALFGTACFSEDSTQEDASQGSSETESAAVSEDTKGEPTQSTQDNASSQQTLQVGDTATHRYGDTTTVYSYIYPAQSSIELWTPSPGSQYAAIDVEGYAGPVEVTGPEGNTLMGFHGFAFALQMSDNTRIGPTVPAVEPVLPAVNLPPGECVRGMVTFEVLQGQTPLYVVEEGATPPARWAIG